MSPLPAVLYVDSDRATGRVSSQFLERYQTKEGALSRICPNFVQTAGPFFANPVRDRCEAIRSARGKLCQICPDKGGRNARPGMLGAWMFVCANLRCAGVPRVRQDPRKPMVRGRRGRDRRADRTGPPWLQDALDRMTFGLTREVKDRLGFARETSQFRGIMALMGRARAQGDGDICAVENGQGGPV